jgi:hypothetical protein
MPVNPEKDKVVSTVINLETAKILEKLESRVPGANNDSKLVGALIELALNSLGLTPPAKYEATVKELRAWSRNMKRQVVEGAKADV